MKFRQDGQGAETELKAKSKEDMRMALEAKERKHTAKTKGINLDFDEERKKDLLLLEQATTNAAQGAVKLVPKAVDADDDEEEEEPESSDDDDEVRFKTMDGLSSPEV
jgi:hypothetical protein